MTRTRNTVAHQKHGARGTEAQNTWKHIRSEQIRGLFCIVHIDYAPNTHIGFIRRIRVLRRDTLTGLCHLGGSGVGLTVLFNAVCTLHEESMGRHGPMGSGVRQYNHVKHRLPRSTKKYLSTNNENSETNPCNTVCVFSHLVLGVYMYIYIFNRHRENWR